MLRILSAIICSIAVVCLIPLLNKAREIQDSSIVSYRLNTFEPQKLQTKKIEDEIVEKELLEKREINSQTPVTSIPVNSPSFDFNFKANLNFSASNISGLQVNRNVVTPGVKKIKTHQGGLSIYSPKPTMPLRAIQLGLSGKVKVRFKINKKGLVEDISIIESSHKIFNSSVFKALKKYRFSPFLNENGQAVEKIRTREFEFNVK